MSGLIPLLGGVRGGLAHLRGGVKGGLIPLLGGVRGGLAQNPILNHLQNPLHLTTNIFLTKP